MFRDAVVAMVEKTFFEPNPVVLLDLVSFGLNSFTRLKVLETTVIVVTTRNSNSITVCGDFLVVFRWV